MPRNKLILDGLWYCLCPSFQLSARKHTGYPLLKGKRGLRPASSAAPTLLPRRYYNSSTSTSTSTSSDADNWGNARNATKYTATDHSRNLRHSPHARDKPTPPHRRPTVGVPNTISEQTTASLETKLQELTNLSSSIHAAAQVLRVLLRDRQVRPNVRHYRAMILANRDAQRGSPEMVRGLLEEMEQHGIPADSVTLHAALQVLAVHPNYLLRQEILRTMRDRWLTLSPDGWHHVVTGLLREHQFELALDHVAHMQRKDIMIQDWLHSLLIYKLCDFEEFDEVLQLMQSRFNQGHDMSLKLWEHVLHASSAAQHEETTRYVWTQRVQLGYLRPSHEICSQVLAVAAHTGDTELAASVVRHLEECGMLLELQDYNSLVETHTRVGNLTAAFEVLCSMHKAGVALEESTTHHVLMYMIQMKMRATDAWNLLKRLKTENKHDLPSGCAKAVIELCEHEAQNDPFAVDEGIDLYKQLYALCPGGADVSIYNTLINMCRHGQNREAAMFVVKEMASLNVIPNGATFERLILMCLDAGNFQSGYLYFQDMLDRGFEPDGGTRSQIRTLCSGSSDHFAVQLKYHPKIREDSVRTKEPVDALVPKERIKKPSRFIRKFRPREGWMLPNLGWKQRRALAKNRRKAKRRRSAIAEARREEGWMDYQPGGLEPEVKV